MELFIVAILIILGVWIFRFFGSSIPTTSMADTEGFAAALPEGFGYPYFLDNTGHAVNVKEKKLLVMSKGRKRIYELENIRGVKYGMDGASQFYLSGGGVSQHINTGLKNRSLKKDAYDTSGIFIEVADIDNPVLQIKYSSEAELRRSVEILQQFMDGTLMDYDEYMKNRKKM